MDMDMEMKMKMEMEMVHFDMDLQILQTCQIAKDTNWKTRQQTIWREDPEKQWL